MGRRSIALFLNLLICAGVFALVSLPLGLILPGIPEVWYNLDASAVDKEAENIVADLGSKPTDFARAPKNFVTANRPSFDPSLPKENRVRASSIGVDGLIYEGIDAKKMLARGIWRTYDFGTPDNETIPTILASHRYGNPRWTKEFRDKEIFFNLDRVKVGDTMEIVWNQRLYRYKVYKTETATQITDTSFALMVYTCNYWNSPLRIFVYLQRT